MIRINLLPVKELKAEVGRRREIWVATVTLVVTVVSILGIYLYQLHRASTLDKELTELRAELQIFNGKAKEVSLIQTKMKEYQSKLQVLESINKKKAGPAGVMDSLSAATPGTLWLTEFRETGGNVTITGIAADNQTIAEFMKALSSYPFFKETELVETTQSEQPGLPPRRFSIKSKLFYQPQAEPAPKDKTGIQPVATKSGH